MSVEDRDLGYSAIINGLSQLGGKAVKVGVFADAGTEPDGTSLADVAIWNEYGTEHIPPRPFMRITADKNEKNWQGLAEKAVGRIIDQGGGSPRQAMEIIGVAAVGNVQQVIGSSELAADSPGTIKRKGSDAPLIDKGRLRQSIKFKLED